jgi:hypothetical protein
VDANGFYWTATSNDPDNAWFCNFAKGSASLGTPECFFTRRHLNVAFSRVSAKSLGRLFAIKASMVFWSRENTSLFKTQLTQNSIQVDFGFKKFSG